MTNRAGSLVYFCDWLPPDFGAVGQYALRFSREMATQGRDVVLIGLTSQNSSAERTCLGAGRLTVIRLSATPADKARLVRRAVWTLVTDCRLVWHARREISRASEILFTGSPPFLIHLLGPLNWWWRKRLIYHISDFHPECLMATMRRVPLALRLFYRLTVFWRRRVHEFQVLGHDQRRHLLALGISNSRIHLKRLDLPVQMHHDPPPLARPKELAGFRVLLYSGNFGVAHDYQTFLAGYLDHHQKNGPTRRVALWLNAVGVAADALESAIRAAGAPIVRTHPGPLDQLPNLLVTPDAHLITLRDEFVGYVMPSKTYGAIASGRPVLFVGSADSDVHRLCTAHLPPPHYFRAPVGSPAAVTAALDRLGSIDEK